MTHSIVWLSKWYAIKPGNRWETNSIFNNSIIENVLIFKTHLEHYGLVNSIILESWAKNIWVYLCFHTFGALWLLFMCFSFYQIQAGYAHFPQIDKFPCMIFILALQLAKYKLGLRRCQTNGHFISDMSWSEIYPVLSVCNKMILMVHTDNNVTISVQILYSLLSIDANLKL